jgi:hypothetical protein
LEHILVAGDNNDIVPSPFRLDGQSADQVVGFVSSLPDHGDVQGLDDAMDEGDLCAHAVGHGRALGLVGLVGFVPQRRPCLVKDHCQAVRLVLSDDF